MKTRAISMAEIRRKVLLTALMVSVAVILPQICHLLGGQLGYGSKLGEMLLPMHLPVMLAGMMGGAVTNPLLYLIPIFNSVQSMIGIFSFEGDLVNVLITVGSNIAVTVVGVYILTRMFNSEKIVYSN